MNIKDTIPVYVYPDGEVYENIPQYKSDDYEVRGQGRCPECDGPIVPNYGEPFASCECGTREWYDTHTETPTEASASPDGVVKRQFRGYQVMNENLRNAIHTPMGPIKDYVDAPKHKFTRRPFILSDILTVPVLVALVFVMATDVHEWWAAFWTGFIGGYVIQSVILTTYISINSLYHGRYWSHEDVSELSEEVHDLRVNNRVLKDLVDEYQELLGGPDTYVVTGESQVK